MFNFYFSNNIIILLIISLSKEINQIKFEEYDNNYYLINLELALDNKSNVNEKNNNIILCYQY